VGDRDYHSKISKFPDCRRNMPFEKSEMKGEDTMETNTPPGTVRSDDIDYRHFELNGHPFLEIADYPDVEEAIRDITRAGWDESSEELMMTCHLVADNQTGTILAVGVYVRSDKSEMPALMWVSARTGTISLRYYEFEYAEYIRKQSLAEKGVSDD
jgi:hypothetical protein